MIMAFQNGGEGEGWEIATWVKQSKSGKTWNLKINGKWCVIQKSSLVKLDNDEIDGVPVKICPKLPPKEQPTTK